MDHTLLAADKAHIDSFQKAFKEYGLKPAGAEKIKPMFGLISYKLIKKLYPHLSLKQCKEVQNLKYKHLVKHSHKYMKPIKGVKQVLKKLKKNYHLGIITNCRKAEIPLLLKSADINPGIFEVLIGNDEVKRPKPAPDEVLKAESIIHHKASYLVGDSIYDMLAGKRAGVKTIGVLTGHFSRAKLNKYKPYKILKSVAELPKYLEKERGEK
ncbi:MAG: HAD family hydrolase [Candidatus Woesebacteria bacterium]|nr:HAD family hydrolase [Candidatus Woesebacteria bacterium]